jgi:hypothetical protein
MSSSAGSRTRRSNLTRVTEQMSSLESDIEATRARLAETIDQLVYRAHPKTIVNRQVTSVKSTFVDVETGQPRTDNILKVAGGVVGVIVVFGLIRKLVK